MKLLTASEKDLLAVPRPDSYEAWEELAYYDSYDPFEKMAHALFAATGCFNAALDYINDLAHICNFVAGSLPTAFGEYDKEYLAFQNSPSVERLLALYDFRNKWDKYEIEDAAGELFYESLFKELSPKNTLLVPDKKGIHVTWVVPVKSLTAKSSRLNVINQSSVSENALPLDNVGKPGFDKVFAAITQAADTLLKSLHSEQSEKRMVTVSTWAAFDLMQRIDLGTLTKHFLKTKRFTALYEYYAKAVQGIPKELAKVYGVSVASRGKSKKPVRFDAVHREAATSISLFLPKEIAAYISQSSSINMSSLFTWSVLWSKFFSGNADIKEVPEYSRPLTEISRVFGKGSVFDGLGSTKTNAEHLCIEAGGGFAYLPPPSEDTVRDYEQTVNKAFDICLRNRMPVELNMNISSDDMSEQDRSELYQCIKKLRGFSSVPLAVNWNVNCVVQPLVGYPAVTTTSNKDACVGADSSSLADLLKNNIGNACERLTGDAPSDSPDKSAETVSNLLKQTLDFREKLIAQGAPLSTIKALRDARLKELGFDSIEDYTAEKTYDATISYAWLSDSSIAQSSGSTYAVGFMRTLDSAGNYQYFKKYAAVKDKDVDDLPEYMPTLAHDRMYHVLEAGKYYLLPHVIFQALKELAAYVNSADLFAFIAKGHEKGVEYPSFNVLSTNVLPFVLLFGTYAPNAMNIIAKADAHFEKTRLKPEDKMTSIKQAFDRMPALPGVANNMSLFPHQIETLYVLERTTPAPKDIEQGTISGAALDIDPGGGKTITGLSEALMLMNKGWVKRPIFYAPVNLTYNWQEDLTKITDAGYNIVTLTTDTWNKWTDRGNKPELLADMLSKLPPNSVVVVANHWLKNKRRDDPLYFGTAVVERFPAVEVLAHYKPDYLIVDESHFVKNANIDMSRALRALKGLPSIKYFRLASGTLIANRSTDLVGQIGQINPYIFGATSFDADYMSADGMSLKKGAAGAIRQRLNSFITCITHKKEEWAFMLPTPVERMFTVPLPADENFKKLYDSIFQESLQALKATDPKTYAYLISGDESKASAIEAALSNHMVKLEQFIIDPNGDEMAIKSGKKLPVSPIISHPEYGINARLRYHYSLKVDNPKANKVLILCRHYRTAQAVFDNLEPKFKKMAVMFTGKDMSAYEDFQSNPDSPAQIAVAIEQNVNTGKNVQIASRIIRVQVPWTPADIDQSVARILRPTPPKYDPKTGEFTDHPLKRESIAIDWIFMENTLQIAQVARLLSKMTEKAKFDYYGRPEIDALPELPMVRMNLDVFNNYTNMGSLGLKTDGTVEGDSYLDVYQRMKATEITYFKKKKETSLSSMVPVRPEPPLPGAKVLKIGLPRVDTNGSAAYKPLPSFYTDFKKAVGDKSTVVKKSAAEVQKPIKEAKETQIKKVLPKTPAVAPKQAAKKPVVSPTIPKKKPGVLFDNVDGKKKNGRIMVFTAIVNGMFGLFLEEDADFSTKYGFRKAGAAAVAYIPNKKRLEDTVAALDKAFELRAVDKKKLLEFADAFVNKVFNPEVGEAIDVKNYYLLKKVMRTNPKEISVVPVISDGELYLMADLATQRAAQRLAAKVRLPGSAAEWYEEDATWMWLTTNLSEVKAKYKELTRNYNVINADEVEAEIAEWRPRKKKKE